jgi:hypothetical protein
MIQGSVACRIWYKRRRGYTADSKQRAVVAVMRKLVRAIFHVARGNEFNESKLFDLRRLDLEGDEAKRKLEADEAKRKLEADEALEVDAVKRSGIDGGSARNSKRLPARPSASQVPFDRRLLAAIEAAREAHELLARADTRQRPGKDLQPPMEPRPIACETNHTHAAKGARAFA